MMDASADGIVVVSRERRIVSINARMVEMWRLPPDVIASGSDEVVVAWAADQVADPGAFTAKLHHLYDHPEERSWDEVVLKNGFVFERYSAPVVGPDGTRYCRVWFFRDVTARKDAERRVRILVDGVKDYAVVLLDPKGRVASWNVGAERLFGYSRDQILGQSLAVLYPDADRARAHKNLEAAVAQGRHEEEGWRLRSTGERFFANVVWNPLSDELGRPYGFAVVTRDITERRRMEDALRTSAERLRLALDAGETGTWEYGLLDNCWMLDARCLALFGFPTAGAQPHTREDVLARIHPADREQARSDFDEAVASAGSFKHEYRVVSDTPSDERWLESAGTVLSNGDQPHRMLGVVHDVTARHRYDEFSRLLPGIVAHDVRSPLSTIKMAVSMIRRSSDPSSSAGRYAETILRGADQIAKMADRLLDFTQARFGGALPLARAPMDLAEVCSEIIDAARIASAEAEVALKVEGDTRGVWDRTRLSEVVSNLVGNAIKHGPAGEPIDVIVRGDGDHVVLSVHNGGTPIPADLLPVLFDPFRRADRTDRSPGAEKSYGLGLYISREIVIAHGGTIEVRSSTTHGTTFTVVLPRGAVAAVSTSDRRW